MSGFQVGPETFVTVSCEVLDADGEFVGEREIIGFVFGRGSLFPLIEQALEGRNAGDRLSVRLDPRDAFGARNPAAVLPVAREEFPADVAAGDRFEVENEDGGLLVIHVLDVADDVVHIDTNHPLAGQTVTMQMEVLDVRVATAEELDAAEQEQQEALDHTAAVASASEKRAQEANRPHVTVQSLIRSRT